MSDEPKLSHCGCCASEPPLRPIENKPGLRAISYRLGTQAIFLERLLDQIHQLKTSSATAAGALAALTTRSTSDASIAVLDAWAVVADILTFYQERIANEGFLRTATERRSVLELTRQIGYELAPGVAASVLLAFTVEEVIGVAASTSTALTPPGPGNSPYNAGIVDIPRGTQLQSVPAPGKLPQTFETSADFQAHVEWNGLRPRLTRIADLAISGGKLYLLGIEAIFPAIAIGYKLLSVSQVYALNPSTKIDPAATHIAAIELHEIYLQGTSTNLKYGDNLLLVGIRSGVEQTLVMKIRGVETDSARNFTRVLFADFAGLPSFAPKAEPAATPAAQNVAFNAANVAKYLLQSTVTEVDLQAFLKTNHWDGSRLAKLVNTPPAAPDTSFGAFAFRAAAAFYGHNAPLWTSLPKPGALRSDPYPSNWDAANSGAGLSIWTTSQGRAHSGADALLERSFPQVLDNSWAYLTSRTLSEVYRINRAFDESVADYNISGKVTALSLNLGANERPVGVSTPSVASWGPDRLDVFAIQSDGYVYHRYFDGQKWNGPDKLPGGNMIHSPSAVSWGPNRLDVFATGSDHSLHHWWYDGKAWSGPQNLGGGFLDNSPAAVSWAAGRLDIFSIGNDGRLYHFWWNGSKWSGPQNLGGTDLRYSPNALSMGPGLLNVVAVSADTYLVDFTWNGNNWSGPNAISMPSGQVWKTTPSSIVFEPGTFAVFAVAQDGNLYVAVWDGSFWTQWFNQPYNLGGGNLSSTPAAVSPAPGILDVFVVSSNGNLYHRRWSSQSVAWSDYENLGGSGNLSGSPGAITRSAKRIDVLVNSTFGQWEYKHWDGASWHGLDILGGPKVPAFLVRQTTAFVQSELLDLQAPPVFDHIPAGASSLMLDNMVVGLAAGQHVALAGIRADAPGVANVELLTLKDVLHEGGYTVLEFTKGLAHSYSRDTVSINANLTLATHGATVQEVLGDGDLSQANRSFTLKRPPLTYVSAPTPNGIASTLEIRVNDLKWTEAPTLYGLGPHAQDYELRLADDGTPTINFGFPASRLRTGSQNVRATYRTGIGYSGNVDAGSIAILMSRPPGLRGVTNPGPASGGADPQPLSKARINAPLTVLTLDRIVSLDDYQDFCSAFAGIGKAQAVEIWSGDQRMVHVTIAAANGDSIASDAPVYGTLTKAIEAAHDPVQHFLLGGYQPLVFHLTASILVNPRYESEVALAHVAAALESHFAFANRMFAQAVTAAEVIALIQSVAGVTAADLSRMYLAGDPKGPFQTEPPAYLAAAPARWEFGAIQPAQLLLLTPKGVDLSEIKS